MLCPRCQHVNPPQAKFGPECGNRLVLTCAQCGTELLHRSERRCSELGWRMLQAMRAQNVDYAWVVAELNRRVNAHASRSVSS